MSAKRKPSEPTSEQTQAWINQKFDGPNRQVALKELRRLEKKHGRLVPQVIVDAARAANSPLHGFFEWDDTVAAEKYRLIQATMLVRHVKVSIQAEDREPLVVRAYVAPYRGEGYVRIETALSDEDMRMQLLAQARADLQAFTKRYRLLEELAEVFQAIDKIDKKPSKKTRKK